MEEQLILEMEGFIFTTIEPFGKTLEQKMLGEGISTSIIRKGSLYSII